MAKYATSWGPRRSARARGSALAVHTLAKYAIMFHPLITLLTAEAVC